MSAFAALHEHGAHFVLVRADTHPIAKRWQMRAEISPPPARWTVRHDG